MSEALARCGICQFSVKDSRAWAGSAPGEGTFLHHKGNVLCRRHPPTVLPNDSKDTGVAVFPLIDPDHWCGEYQPRGEVSL